MKKHYLLLVVAAFLSCVAFSKPLESDAINQAVAVEDAFAEVIQAAKPSVVTIANKQIPKNRFGMGNPFDQFFPDEWFEFFGIPRDRQPQRQRQQQPKIPQKVGMGSGVLIQKDGYIVTNYHVIENCDFLEVKTSDGKVYDNEQNKEAVKIVGYDKETDLAVLKINAKEELPYLEFADSDKLRVGQWAIAIGAPFNLDNSITIGCVSQKGRHGMGMANFDDYIQTDASINPGNSGGPLLNIRGEIIGINQFIVTGGGASRGSVGIGFAIASNLVRQTTDSLIKSGKVDRAYLGIALQELPKEFGIDHGVLVREVMEDSAAEKAGIKNGDVVTSVNGQPVTTVHELMMLVGKYQPQEVLKLEIVRGDKEMLIPVKAGKRPFEDEDDEEENADETDEEEKEIDIKNLGLTLQEKNGKVVISGILPDGAVAKLRGDGNDSINRIQPGDILLEVNRTEVSSIQEVKKAVKNTSKNSVILYLERRQPNMKTPYRFFVAVPI